MAGQRKIVYPDADEATCDLFTGERLSRVSAIGNFSIYTDTPESVDVYLERIGDADGILLGWSLPDDVLFQAPNLKCIAFTGIGVANFVNLDLARKQGITVTNTPGYADQTVAEHTMGLMLATARHIAALDRDTRKGGWNKAHTGFDLNGKTLGLVGLGGIGTRTAKLANAFGMNVIAWTRKPSPERAAEAGVAFQELNEVLANSDIVSLHLTATPETGNLLNKERLARMKPGAVLINTARAEIVEEHALLDALESGNISAAGLDVFHEEPLPPDHPFRQMENVVVTPHTGFNTPEANNAITDIALDSLAAYFNGSPINVVTAPD